MKPSGLVSRTDAMIAGMTPCLDEPTFIFATAVEPDPAALSQALSIFREAEGVSLILEMARAAALGFDLSSPMRRIVLEVYSSLEGVGLTAAVANALSARGISCNMVAAFHHDHVFVPAARANEAMAALLEIQAAARR